MDLMTHTHKTGRSIMSVGSLCRVIAAVLLTTRGPSRTLFIHVTPVAEAHLSNASPFQTPLITPNNKLIKPTNKDNFLTG
jgi:hypothetical protein